MNKTNHTNSKNLIYNQQDLSHKRGSYGPLGSLAANGCGAVAVYNLLILLGRKHAANGILESFSRHWLRSTHLFGLLGTRLSFVKHYLTSCNLHVRIYRKLSLTHSKRICMDVGYHRFYIVRYFSFGMHPLITAHYQLLERQSDGQVKSYNQPSSIFHDVRDYCSHVGADYITILGID